MQWLLSPKGKEVVQGGGKGIHYQYLKSKNWVERMNTELLFMLGANMSSRASGGITRQQVNNKILLLPFA